MTAARFSATRLAARACQTLAVLAAVPAPAEVALTRRDDRIDVAVDNAAFTSYVHSGHRKPILFPVYGPGGVPMEITRPTR